jgi:hypothetical protein
MGRVPRPRWGSPGVGIGGPGGSRTPTAFAAVLQVSGLVRRSPPGGSADRESPAWSSGSCCVVRAVSTCRQHACNTMCREAAGYSRSARLDWWRDRWLRGRLRRPNYPSCQLGHSTSNRFTLRADDGGVIQLLWRRATNNRLLTSVEVSDTKDDEAEILVLNQNLLGRSAWPNNDDRHRRSIRTVFERGAARSSACRLREMPWWDASPHACVGR